MTTATIPQAKTIRDYMPDVLTHYLRAAEADLGDWGKWQSARLLLDHWDDALTGLQRRSYSPQRAALIEAARHLADQIKSRQLALRPELG